MASPYKLTYFNVRGKGEPIRLLLAHAGVQYEDDRFERADWGPIKSKTDWGKLPIFYVGDFVINQSGAILRYLAAKHGYLPSDLKEATKCDEYLHAIMDYVTGATKFMHIEDPDLKTKTRDDFERDSVPFYLEKITKILKSSGGPFLLGSKITFPDFSVAHFLNESYSVYGKAFEPFPEIRQYIDHVFGLPGLKEWIASRPPTTK